MHHGERDRRGDLRAEVAVGHAVEAVAAHLREAEQLCGEVTVQRIGGAGQCAGAKRTYIHTLHGVFQAADVSEEHLGIRQQMMTEGDGLCALQMGVAGHHGVGVFLRLIAQHVKQLLDLLNERSTFLAQRQAHIERNLIVAAAGGVQALAGVADAGGQFALHKGVDVFGVRVDEQGAACDIGFDLLETGADLLALALFDDAGFAQHGGVGNAALDILLIHPAVHGDGGVEIIGFRVQRFLEAAFPQFHIVRPFLRQLISPAR